MCFFNKKDKEKKYNINKKLNVPEFVYGTPDYIMKEIQKQEQEKKEKKERMKAIAENVFSAYIVNKSALSRYYYINKVENQYQFLYGNSSNGDYIENDIDTPSINYISKDENYYHDFINQLIQITKDWNETYKEEDLNSEIKWNIKLVKEEKVYSGVNDFPDNFNKAMELIEKYF